MSESLGRRTRKAYDHYIEPDADNRMDGTYTENYDIEHQVGATAPKPCIDIEKQLAKTIPTLTSAQ